MKILDHGRIELYDCMASELSIVNSARISFNTRKQVIDESDEGLIKFLMREKHGSPFEHNAFTFNIKAPIFVLREWFRHRIGSFNEVSARYTELPGEWYIPEIANVRTRVGKPGRYQYKMASKKISEQFIGDLDAKCKVSYMRYKEYLESGIAPEQARMLLHVNHYSEIFWTVNARSLMNFLSLRNSEFAQWEIKMYAEAVESIFADKMPVTYAAFVDGGRVAP